MDLFNGILSIPWWGCVIVALLYTHLTIVTVTLYLHRAQAHRSLDIGWILKHLFFRPNLYTTTGMTEREWVAIHRKHHARCEMEGDPHSPVVWLEGVEGRWRRALYMVWFIAYAGVRMYVRESYNAETLKKHGQGTTDDWIERNLYSRFPKLGILISLTVNIVFFGVVPGFCIWLVQMIWIPVFAAGVINGIGHYAGYRNFENAHRITGVVDSSTNICRWGILIGGEELHNNHHHDELSAKFSMKPGEFDIGWLYIRIANSLGLIRSIRKPSL